MSYSQIKLRVPVSKSTLSLWFGKYPLSEKRLRELRDINSKRIEPYRATMKKKRDVRISLQSAKVARDLNILRNRELFVVGFFLFWGEGSKTRKSEVSLANTDPTMIRFFTRWLLLLGADKRKIHFTFHFYSDMHPQVEHIYWSRTLGYPLLAFHKPYIKKTKLSDVTYRNGFGHGTCNARYMSQELNDYILMGLKYIRGLYE